MSLLKAGCRVRPSQFLVVNYLPTKVGGYWWLCWKIRRASGLVYSSPNHCYQCLEKKLFLVFTINTLLNAASFSCLGASA